MAKTAQKNFDDIKMLIATFSITMTLVFWHLFSASAPDPSEQVAIANNPQIGVSAEPSVSPTPQPTPQSFVGKILLGGQAPQPQIIVQNGRNNGNNGNNNNNNNNNGGGTVVTQTGSS